MNDMEEVRRQFPILGTVNYLNSCSLGALSLRAEERLSEFTQRWHRMGASAWYEHWLGAIEELRGEVAGLFNAPAATVALLPSTSACLAMIAESLEAGTRRRIVTTELDFPTLLYQWKVRPDVELVILESDDGVRVDPQKFEDAVDERTLMIATSHVFFTTGHIQNLEVLSSVAHRVGALCLIDGYQGAGQIPLDLPATGVDFYTAGPLKWLCGGPGLAYMYVREPLNRELEPRITSWFATKDQFEFNPGAFRYHDDARRFELGTPALPTVYTALGGHELVTAFGVSEVRARNQSLTQRLIEQCLEAGCSLRMSPDPETRSAILLIEHGDPGAVVRALAERKVIVDYRPGVVRVSPHFYNSEDEVDAFVGELVQAAGA
ncbi:MAG: aminotransferase class V-fold PLP-dependent enzyme [Gemmatimonadota bacterium]|nr:aminotransferase class V-fold PLP-dependent enzyme [Gemmatimonadota bacterium]